MKTKAEYEKERRKRLKAAGWKPLSSVYVPEENHAEEARRLRKKYPPPRKEE